MSTEFDAFQHAIDEFTRRNSENEEFLAQVAQIVRTFMNNNNTNAQAMRHSLVRALEASLHGAPAPTQQLHGETPLPPGQFAGAGAERYPAFMHRPPVGHG